MSYVLLGLIRVWTGAQARGYGCPPKAEQRIYFANHQSQAGLCNLADKFPTIELVPAWINHVQRVMPNGEVVPVPGACCTGSTHCALQPRLLSPS